MNKPTAKTIRKISIGAILSIGALVLLVWTNNDGPTPACQDVRFDAYYTEAIDALHAHTRTVQNQLRGNSIGELEILPEQYLRLAEEASAKAAQPPAEPTLKDITLRGIYWSDAMPLAEINDRLCRPGDLIDGFTLAKIQPYSILLKAPTGSTHTVSLIKSF